MSELTAVVFASAEFDADYFVVSFFAEDVGGDGSAADVGCADFSCVAVLFIADEEDLVEGEGGLVVGDVSEVDLDLIANGYFCL